MIALAWGVALIAAVAWPGRIIGPLDGAPFDVPVKVVVFADGPLLIETKMGAMSTVAGALVAIAAARLLHVGRFARQSETARRLRQN